MLPKQYHFLHTVGTLPKMIQEGLKLINENIVEIPGPKSHPAILKMAADAGVSNIYNNDDVPWCAVAQTAICLRAGKVVSFTGYDRLRAACFVRFGNAVASPMLGDVMVFKRPGGYHVNMYIAEDEKCYHGMGGNQSNRFNITRIEKSRLYAARRPHYNNMPPSVKKYFVSPAGIISQNES